jgi:hypothetical protein
MRKDVLYELGLFTYVLIIFLIADDIQAYQKSNFFYMSDLIALLLLVINVVFGVLIGLESILVNLKKNGAWVVNFRRILLVSLPSLIPACSFYIFQSGFAYKILGILYTKYNIAISFSLTAMTLGQILLGYSLITSISKRVGNNE